MRDPALAAVLGAIVPRMGQFYNGRVPDGVLWLIGTGGLPGRTAHVVSAYTHAHRFR